MRSARVFLLAGAALLLAAPVLAHHSTNAEYDTGMPVTLKGKITKVSWKNPHVTFVMDVRNPDGKTANWQVEMGSPNLLLSQGWSLTSLKSGDEVVVDGYAARNHANLASARKVTLEAH